MPSARPSGRPSVPEPGHVAAVVGVSAALTWSLRAAPFAVLAPMRESAVVGHLSILSGATVHVALATVLAG